MRINVIKEDKNNPGKLILATFSADQIGTGWKETFNKEEEKRYVEEHFHIKENEGPFSFDGAEISIGNFVITEQTNEEVRVYNYSDIVDQLQIVF